MATNGEELRRYVNRLEKYDNQAAELYDRWVISTSGLALAVTLSFVRELDQPLEHGWTLLTSWACLSASVVLTLVSIYLGRISMRRMITYVRENQSQNVPKEVMEPWARMTETLNKATLVIFAVGLTAVVAFGVVNLGPTEVSDKPEKPDNSASTSRTVRVIEGYSPTPPPSDPVPIYRKGYTPTTPPSGPSGAAPADPGGSTSPGSGGEGGGSAGGGSDKAAVTQGAIAKRQNGIWVSHIASTEDIEQLAALDAVWADGHEP